MNKKTVHTRSASQTQKFAEQLSLDLKGGEVLALYGDLGSGKTTFTQGLAGGLGISKNINSPTFIIMRSYEIPNSKSQITNFYHIDLYRTDNTDDVAGLGLSDILNKSDSVVVIEWPEKMGKLLPEKRIDIQFEYVDENERKISIENSKSQNTPILSGSRMESTIRTSSK